MVRYSPVFTRFVARSHPSSLHVRRERHSIFDVRTEIKYLNWVGLPAGLRRLSGQPRHLQDTGRDRLSDRSTTWHAPSDKPREVRSNMHVHCLRAPCPFQMCLLEQQKFNCRGQFASIVFCKGCTEDLGDDSEGLIQSRIGDGFVWGSRMGSVCGLI